VRPLDRVPSIKLKLGVAIVIAVGVSSTVSFVGFQLGVPIWVRPFIAVAIALVMVQVLARGMTSPLREMAVAAMAMARGNYERRVTATSADEVGELARAFNAMAAQLAEVDRQRRDLIANVSHELRTPLTALRAQLENVVDGVGAPDAETLDVMLRQVDRLSRLVAQLLDLSRLEAGIHPFDRSEVQVAEVVDAAVAEVKLASPGAELVVDAAPDLCVSGDGDRLQQVVMNLIENAVRHSPAGSPVAITATRANGSVRLEVSDAGSGIADGDSDRIFERFYRADTARTSSGGGAGLGLSIARWIVDLHGGEIHAEPRHPTGCRVVVTLPEQPGGTTS
jgi:signal transduction histidine kinase